MSRILVIAKNTFRENEVKKILDLGLASISIFGMAIAVFLGIGLVYKELDKRTIYALLAKPIQRYEFILGKYLGLLYTLLVNVAVMTAGLELALLYQGETGWSVFLNLLPAVFIIYMSLALVTALALLFSTFSTPALSALFTFFLWLIGHFGRDLLQIGGFSKSVLIKWICTAIYYVIPNLSIFKILSSRHITQSVSFYQPMDPAIVAAAFFYCIVYCAIILSLSIAIFLRRDFK
jgi:ABC-type transport system involved in multi-copper enzyme maturation permease subunit